MQLQLYYKKKKKNQIKWLHLLLQIIVFNICPISKSYNLTGNDAQKHNFLVCSCLDMQQ